MLLSVSRAAAPTGRKFLSPVAMRGQIVRQDHVKFRTLNLNKTAKSDKYEITYPF